MKKTRNLFVLKGPSSDVSNVLGVLQFKGLISFAFGTTVTASMVEKVFKNNKSAVCSADDYHGNIPENAIQINVEQQLFSNSENQSQTIFVSEQHITDQFLKISENLGCDIGDHKSNSSGQSTGPTIKDCAYCKYLSGIAGQNEKVLYRSKNFFVIPTLGQLITGYLLVIPFKHVMSNAELDDESIEEYETVLEDIEFIIKLTYNVPNILVWENGSGKSGTGKAKDSVVHSHVHVAPSNLTSDMIEHVSGFQFDTISLKYLKKYKEHSYLLLRTPNYSSWKINNNPELYIPRQYVRQLIAQEYNIPGELWNWRKYPFRNNMHQTAVDIVSALQKNWSMLPKRIQNNTAFLF